MRVRTDEELRAALRREADGIAPDPTFAGRAVAAAKRGRRVRRRWIGAGAAGLAAATAGALAAVVLLEPAELAGTEVRDAEPGAPTAGPDLGTCPVGEVRPRYPGFPGGESMVLGCAQLRDGRQVELRSHQPGGGCLQILGVDDGLRECGNAPSEQDPPYAGKPIAAQMIAQRDDSAPLEVYGATSPDVTMVELAYTADGPAQQTFAELIRVTDDEILEKAGIAEPFGYFLDELPPDVTNVNAVALDAEGQRLGTDSFEPYLNDQPRTAPISGPASTSPSPQNPEVCPTPEVRPSYLPWVAPGDPLPPPEISDYPPGPERPGILLQWHAPSSKIPDIYSVILRRFSAVGLPGAGETIPVRLFGELGEYHAGPPGDGTIWWVLPDYPCNVVALDLNASGRFTGPETQQVLARIAESIS